MATVDHGQLRERLLAFMAERIYPAERRFYAEAERLGPWAVWPVVDEEPSGGS